MEMPQRGGWWPERCLSIVLAAFVILGLSVFGTVHAFASVANSPDGDLQVINTKANTNGYIGIGSDGYAYGVRNASEASFVGIYNPNDPSAYILREAGSTNDCLWYNSGNNEFYVLSMCSYTSSADQFASSSSNQFSQIWCLYLTGGSETALWYQGIGSRIIGGPENGTDADAHWQFKDQA